MLWVPSARALGAAPARFEEVPVYEWYGTQNRSRVRLGNQLLNDISGDIKQRTGGLVGRPVYP